MKKRILCSAFLFGTLLIISACSPPRPVIFEAEHFDGKAVGEGHTAYLLPTSVDLKEVVQGFVVTFDGNPAEGESFILQCMDEYLSYTGVAKKRSLRSRSYYKKMSLTNLAGLPDPPDFGSMFDSETDKYGIIQQEITDPEGLAAYMEKNEMDHLVLCLDLRVLRKSKAQGVYGVPGPGGTTTVLGGGSSNTGILTGQVIIWERATQSIVWNGYVEGAMLLYKGFDKRSVQALARDFVIDLGKVLR